jgi:2OG-Fe(II) oxygenase superfamily
MAAHETIETLSGALMSDERILNVAEREFLANLIQRAHHNVLPENKNVPGAIVQLVGEIVAERAYGVLGDSITQQLLNELTSFTKRTTAPIRLGGPAPGLPPAPDPIAPRPPGPTPPGPHIRESRSTFRISDSPMNLGGPAPGLPPAPSPNSPRPPGPTPPGDHIQETKASSSGTTLAEQPLLLSAQCVLLDEFLAPEELQDLMQDTLSREMGFQISEVIAPGAAGGVTDFEHRRSHVLTELGKRREIILARLQGCLPRVLRKLDQELFRPSRVEMQITASNDGDFFHWHSDNAGETIASREITFVYFFHREPKTFRGGELRIYDSQWENGMYRPTQNYRTIVPQQNQVVLFASALAHEITPVKCPSKAFADSRFTVNGWFHR